MSKRNRTLEALAAFVEYSVQKYNLEDAIGYAMCLVEGCVVLAMRLTKEEVLSFHTDLVNVFDKHGIKCVDPTSITQQDFTVTNEQY